MKRCTVLSIPGSACPRPAAEGSEYCEGHGRAMARQGARLTPERLAALKSSPERNPRPGSPPVWGYRTEEGDALVAEVEAAWAELSTLTAQNRALVDEVAAANAALERAHRELVVVRAECEREAKKAAEYRRELDETHADRRGLVNGVDRILRQWASGELEGGEVVAALRRLLMAKVTP